jgi:two-component system, NtrC family, sensor kinase
MNNARISQPKSQGVLQIEIMKFTRDFAETVARIGGAMLNTEFTVRSVDYIETGLSSRLGMFCSILFTGTVYGEYMLAVSPEASARLMQGAGYREEDASDTLCEFLNVVVGESIVDLGRTYEKLTLTSPRMYSGSIHYPKIRTGRAVLESTNGIVECYFFLDLMKLDISSSYSLALGSLEKAHGELQTAMKKLQDQQGVLVQSEKLAALGTMAAGVAHEINNPLAAVLTLGGQLQDMITDDPIDRMSCISALENIHKTVDRISKITGSMRAMAHGVRNGDIKPASVRTLVNDALLFCSHQAENRGIRITHAPGSELTIQCRAAQISQAILNLLLNACDAAEATPEKWIDLAVSDLGNQVAISVTDSGQGIAQEIVGKIFDPFFTTKDVGKGRGLGLSLCKGIVEEHGGTIQVDASCKNTRFVITLPKIREP